MTRKLLIPAILAATFVSAPAFGQTAYENCKTNDTQSQVLGAVIGGSLGAVLGNEVSGDTGAVVGGLAGGTAGVAIADKDCERYKARPYTQSNQYGTTTTNQSVRYDQYGNRIVTTTTVQPEPVRAQQPATKYPGYERVYDASNNSYYYRYVG